MLGKLYQQKMLQVDLYMEGSLFSLCEHNNNKTYILMTVFTFYLLI